MGNFLSMENHLKLKKSIFIKINNINKLKLVSLTGAVTF